MAKSAFASFTHPAGLGALMNAVVKAAERMKLKHGAESQGPEGFVIIAREPMRWLTTNYPITFRVEATPTAGSCAVTIEASCALPSITQDRHNAQRAQELADLIRVYATV